MSLILALSLVVSLISGVTAFAADSTKYPPITMDSVVDETRNGRRLYTTISDGSKYGKEICLGIPIGEFFKTGCIGSAESSGWLEYSIHDKNGDNITQMWVRKYEDTDPWATTTTWTLKDGVCVIDSYGHREYLGGKYSPFYGNPYIKTVVTNISSDIILDIVNKDICPNLETIICRGTLYKIKDNTVNIIGLNGPDANPEIRLTDGTYLQYCKYIGQDYETAMSEAKSILNKTSITMSQEAINQVTDPRGTYRPTRLNELVKFILDSAQLKSFPTTPDMGYTPWHGQSGQPTPTPTPVIDNNTKLSDWAKDRIEQAFKLDIAKADWNGKDLTKPVTRMEFCIIAMEIFQTATHRTPDVSKKNSFTDVTANADAINGAYNMGIINGYDSHTFGPDNYISREQAATMLNRLANACDKAMPLGANPFTDTISSWALDGVTRCYAAGVMNGVGGKTFDANGLYTAEQSIVSNMRLYDYLTE